VRRRCWPATDLYWAGRLTLVSRHEEIAGYDRVFRGVFAEEPRRVRVDVEPEVALASRSRTYGGRASRS
jgi:uncharacterized protein with von Willebrand factor type A (vWA) domain